MSSKEEDAFSEVSTDNLDGSAKRKKTKKKGKKKEKKTTLPDPQSCDFTNEPPSPPPQPKPVECAPLLPPDHPLLEKFQAHLNAYLIRSRDQLKEQIDEIKYRIKIKEQQREEEGAKLFDRQQEMTYQHEQIEEFTKKISENSELRQNEEAVVEKLKNEYDSKLTVVKECKTLYNKRTVELEQLNVLENNIRQWSEELDDEVKNAKRMVDRDTEIQQQISEEKKKSDMLFFHLDTEVKRNEKELETIREEICTMEETINVLHQSVSCANTDLEVLQTEHKHLHQAWADVIIAISHRDKLLHQLNVEIAKQREEIKLSSSSIEAIKKQINKELEQNEKLKSFKARLHNDFMSLKRECQKQSNVLVELEAKLDELPAFLAQTEKDMNEARREGNALETEVRRIQWKLDKESNKKYQIEEQILKVAQEQLVTDTASEYRHKLLNKARETRRQLDLKLANAQNQLSELLLEMEQHKNQIFRMRQENDELKAKLEVAETKSDNLSAELKNLEYQMDVKLKRIDKLNTDLDNAKRIAESTVNSPTDVKIMLLEKTIAAAELQIREHQRFWLMLQNHFVHLSQKRNNQLNEIQVSRKQLAIIKQKSLKIDRDLELSEDKARELTREINVFTSKIQLLNGKMAAKQQEHETEESICEMEHGELVSRLKDHEMEVLKLEQEINDIQTEIDYLKDLVLDRHRDALAWETKYKLIEETIRWHKDENSLESEIGTMKSEIHRMKIRHSELKRAQEKLIDDLNHCVTHRENIFTTVSNRQAIDSAPSRSKTTATITQKILDLRSKLKQIQDEICYITETKLKDVAGSYECVQSTISELRDQIRKECCEYEALRLKIEDNVLLKYVNLENIVRKQNRAKAYQRLKTGLPTQKLQRSETSINSMMQKQTDINHNLMEILQDLIVEVPQHKTYFTKVLQILKD